MAGTPTTAGCPAFAYVPTEAAVVVRRLRQAGAVPVAKTNLDQFATGLVGTRSPYGDPAQPGRRDRVPGGSSSGSAVAVAAGLVPFALGTDTAGSGRVPAAFTGIVGLKPTRGTVSTRGIVPAVRSLDCPSIFARTVAGAWSVLAASRGFDPDDEFSRDVAPVDLGPEPRVGVLRPAVVDALCDAPTADAYRGATAVLERLGYLVEPVDVKPFLDAGRLLYEGPWVAERYAAVGAFLEAHRGDAGVDPVVASHRAGRARAHRGRGVRGFVPPRRARPGDGRRLVARRRARAPDHADVPDRRRGRRRPDRCQRAARYLHDVRQPARPLWGHRAGSAARPTGCRPG